MNVRTVALWSLINGKAHASLGKKERTVEAFMPLVNELFPGINYYSISGFGEVMRDCVIPVLKKRHGELLNVPSERVDPGAMTEVVPVLPSNGYEWQDSVVWRRKLERILSAS